MLQLYSYTKLSPFWSIKRTTCTNAAATRYRLPSYPLLWSFTSEFWEKESLSIQSDKKRNEPTRTPPQINGRNPILPSDIFTQARAGASAFISQLIVYCFFSYCQHFHDCFKKAGAYAPTFVFLILLSMQPSWCSCMVGWSEARRRYLIFILSIVTPSSIASENMWMPIAFQMYVTPFVHQRCGVFLLHRRCGS